MKQYNKRNRIQIKTTAFKCTKSQRTDPKFVELLLQFYFNIFSGAYIWHWNVLPYVLHEGKKTHLEHRLN